jgi:hypothetical protein
VRMKISIRASCDIAERVEPQFESCSHSRVYLDA